MAASLEDKLARLPGDRRAKVDARAAESASPLERYAGYRPKEEDAGKNSYERVSCLWPVSTRLQGVR